MTNLSELSNPVAWEVKGILCHSEEARIYVGEPEPLYSQEYVSALTQRIAELERANQSQDDHINQQQDRIDSLEKKNGDLGRSLGAAEKRLATPVRLPDIRSDDYHETGWFQHMKYYRDVERSILAAGFTMGDE